MLESNPYVHRSSEHDVIVVGASVAGCRAALTMAETGLRVLLLDRAEFPRWKPCAGGLTLKTRPYLPDPLFDLVEQTVYGTRLTFGDECVAHIRSDDPLGWMVHRETFDQTHLQLAESLPSVDLMTGTKVLDVREHETGVIVVTNAGELEAPVAVGADGALSVVSRFLPGHEDRLMGFAYEGEAGPLVSGGDEVLTDETLFDFKRFPRGYGWVFAKRDHYSVGGFVFESKLPAMKELYQEFCREAEGLPGVETYRARGHPIALGGDLRRVNSKRIVLVGEAGGLVDPLTGEGIYYALRTGHLAGEAIAQFLKYGKPLETYGNQVRDEIQEEFRRARALARFVYQHPRLSFRLLFRNALLCRWFAEIGAGTKSYRGLLKQALKMGLLLPFHAGFGKEMEVRVDLAGWGPAAGANHPGRVS